MNIEIASTWDGKDYFLYKNHVTMQSPVAIEVFEHFFTIEKFDLMVEIGTAGGGWTIFLQEAANSMDAKFITYDIHNFPQKGLEFANLGIDFRLKNVFSNSQEIIDLISQPDKRVALFCDGGDKIKEFNLFSYHLKSGDFIFAHDYAPSYKFFMDHMHGVWWDWCEISDDYISTAFEENNFVKYSPDFFIKSAWMAAQKHD